MERQLAGLISLTPGDKLRMAKLGDKADVFCRQTLEALAGQPPGKNERAAVGRLFCGRMWIGS
ncbi:MAG: hypothetical protein IPK27_22130 [Rhodanobacteraceae bacterium]|nr:hypothetical protein [Rhodanobacteraceae bacterium]